MDKDIDAAAKPSGHPGGSPGSTARAKDSPSLLCDCRLMLSYARKNNFVLRPALLHEIAWLDSVLKSLDIPPISHIAADLVWALDQTKGEPRYVAPTCCDGTLTVAADDAAGAGKPCAKTPEEVILDIHSQLSELLASTTALTLQTSEPPPGKRHIFGGMPPLVQYVIIVALLSALGFVYTASDIAKVAADAKAAQKTNPSIPGDAKARTTSSPAAPAQAAGPKEAASTATPSAHADEQAQSPSSGRKQAPSQANPQSTGASS